MGKTVVLLRHAKPKSESYADDSLRPLSDEGIKIQRELSLKLKNKEILPTGIYTSPFLRAVQTAEVMSDHFGVPFVEEPALGDHFDSEKLLDRICEAEEQATLFFVGHAPTLVSFAHQLAGKNILPDGLSKSSAAIIHFDGPAAFGNGSLIEYFK